MKADFLNGSRVFFVSSITIGLVGCSSVAVNSGHDSEVKRSIAAETPLDESGVQCQGYLGEKDGYLYVVRPAKSSKYEGLLVFVAGPKYSTKTTQASNQDSQLFNWGRQPASTDKNAWKVDFKGRFDSGFVSQAVPEGTQYMAIQRDGQQQINIQITTSGSDLHAAGVYFADNGAHVPFENLSCKTRNVGEIQSAIH